MEMQKRYSAYPDGEFTTKPKDLGSMEGVKTNLKLMKPFRSVCFARKLLS